MASIEDLPLYFGWQVKQRGSKTGDDDAVSLGAWPRAHFGARILALAFFVAFHIAESIIWPDEFWRTYGIYWTFWSLFLATIYFGLMTVATCWLRQHVTSGTRVKDPSKSPRNVAIVLRLCSTLLLLAVVNEVCITILYWTVILPVEVPDSPERWWTNSLVHSVPVLCLLGEFLFTRIPIYRRDVWLFVVEMVLYAIVNASYSLTNMPVYPVLTWKTVSGYLYLAGAIVFAAIVMLFLFGYRRWQFGEPILFKREKRADTVRTPVHAV